MMRIYIELVNVPEDKIVSRIEAGKQLGEYDEIKRVVYEAETKELKIWGTKK